MSINVDLDHLLQQLPEVLSWIVPGLLLIFAYRILRYEEGNDEKESISILRVICISFFVRYAVIIVLSWFSGDWLWGLDGSIWIAICSCLGAFFLGSILGLVSNLTFVKKFSEKYLHFTIDSNPLFDLADKKNGCFVRVYLTKNQDEYIFGIYSNCYNRTNEDWLVVKNAIRIRGNLDEIKEKDYKNNKKTSVSKLLINTRDVELIEYIYTENQQQHKKTHRWWFRMNTIKKQRGKNANK